LQILRGERLTTGKEMASVSKAVLMQQCDMRAQTGDARESCAVTERALAIGLINCVVTHIESSQQAGRQAVCPACSTTFSAFTFSGKERFVMPHNSVRRDIPSAVPVAPQSMHETTAARPLLQVVVSSRLVFQPKILHVFLLPLIRATCTM
jgi:hypothetical protein